MARLERQLAERKELLVLRSTLNRARLRYQFVALRSRVPSRRTTVVGVVLFALMRLGVGRWIANAGRVLVLVRAARSAFRLLRRR
jgi:hypothetical protein